MDRLYTAGIIEDLAPFLARVAEVGRRIALGMTLLKLTVPGVPDIYWGDELEALNLVDPDNRRPVDWERRRRALAEVRCGTAPRDETAKLAVIARTLELRAERADAFAGSYEPVEAGPRSADSGAAMGSSRWSFPCRRGRRRTVRLWVGATSSPDCRSGCT